VLGEKSTKAGFWITFVLMQVLNGKLLSIRTQTSRVVAAHRHARELPSCRRATAAAVHRRVGEPPPCKTVQASSRRRLCTSA